jgi:hypothetical protein
MGAGTSTNLMSAMRHCRPNASDPSLVIRLTTCSGGSDGGMIGAGGGVCASDCDMINTASAITPAMTFGMFSSRCDFGLPCN